MRAGFCSVALLTVLWLPCTQGQQVMVEVMGQQRPASTKRFTLTGTVVNSVTGAPISRALVDVNGTEQRSVFTGPDGRFQVDNILEGQYFANAQKPGFVTRNEATRPISVGANTSATQIKLVPQASIEGRVLDSDGDPIEGVEVTCINRLVQNGRKTWQLGGNGQTDQRGEFRIDNLDPGSYLLKTAQEQLFPGFSGERNSEAAQQIYPTRFYPNAGEIASAQTITLRPGEKAEADFTLAPVKGYRVSGTLAPAGGRAFVEVEDANGQSVTNGMGVNANKGTWTIPALPAGSWKLVFRTAGNHRTTQLQAEQVVNVTTSDIRDVQVALQAPVSIAMRVSGGPQVEDAAPLSDVVRVVENQPLPGVMPQMAAMVRLEPESPAGFGLGGFGRRFGGGMSQNGQIEAVPPGEYAAIVQSTSGDYCMDSISSGGVDLTRSHLVVMAGSQPAPIDVSLSQSCASIQGQVHMDNATNGAVVLVPASAAMEPQIVGVVNGQGQFNFGGLSPGDYQLYAFSDISDIEYRNPDVMRDFSGAQVTLSPKQQATVTLDLIMRPHQ